MSPRYLLQLARSQVLKIADFLEKTWREHIGQLKERIGNSVILIVIRIPLDGGAFGASGDFIGGCVFDERRTFMHVGSKSLEYIYSLGMKRFGKSFRKPKLNNDRWVILFLFTG